MKNLGEKDSEDSNEAKKSIDVTEFYDFEKEIKAIYNRSLKKDSQKSDSKDSASYAYPQLDLDMKVKFNIGKLIEEIANLKANRELRDKYSFKAFKVVKKSLWGWAILLFIYGLVKLLTRHENGGFEIFSDHVLIAITTATTLNIYAGFLSLIRGLFPSIKEYSKKK